MKWIIFKEWLRQTWENTWIFTICVLGYSAVWFVYLTSGIAIVANPKENKSFREQMRWE